MNSLFDWPDTQTVVLKPPFPPPSSIEVAPSDFYNILRSLIGGGQNTDEDLTLQKKPQLNDGSSIKPQLNDGPNATPLSKLVTARTLQNSTTHRPLHAVGHGSHTSMRMHHPHHTLHPPSWPLSGGVASRTENPPGVVSRHAEGLGDQSLCSTMARSSGTTGVTTLLASTSKRSLSGQPCLDSRLPPPPPPPPPPPCLSRCVTSHGWNQSGESTQSSCGSLARMGAIVLCEEMEVVSVLDLGLHELLHLEQLLANTQEVVVSLAHGGFGDSVTDPNKGTNTTGEHMVDGFYIAIPLKDAAATPFQRESAVVTPFQREGAVATPFQREGAVVTPFQREGAVATLIEREGAVTTLFQKEGAVVTPFQREGAVVTPFQREGAAQVPGAVVMRCWFVPLKHCTPEIYTWCRSQLASLLRHARVICYNGQQLARTLLDHYQLDSQSSEWIHWTFLDTLIGSWLLDPDHPPQTFSEALIRAGLDVTRSSTGFNNRELLMLAPLMNKLHQMLQKEDLWELFVTVEVKLIPILAAMEVFGIQINCHKLFEFADAVKNRVSKVEFEVHKAAGHTFSVNSTAQLRQVLFDELHLEKRSGHALNKTQVNRFTSTSEEVLMQLQEFHPLPKLVLEYRQLCKLNAAFIQGTISHVNGGVMRPHWQHTGTATGRITSTNPNIQAFPKVGLDLGIVKEQYIIGKAQEQVTINIREIIQSRTGYTFLAADFRSIELRIIAHLSGDQRLLTMLAMDATGETDVFTHLTSEWLGIPLERAGTSERERTKRVVYAVIYGVGRERLGSILKTSADHAKALMDSFLAKFPAIKLYMNGVVLDCRKSQQGNVSTICRRKRWFPHITSANPNLRAHSERQAINFPIQGSAADVFKCGMIQVVHMLAERSPRTRLLIQIHDELVFEVPDNEVQSISGMIKVTLENPLLPIAECLKVPLEVRLTAGKNWATMSEVKGHMT